MQKILEAELKNGLKIVGEYRGSAESCSLGFIVRTGARDETEKEAGLSHFLEHMMFKGTAKRSAKQVNEDLGSLGAQANAFTSNEITAYFATILPEYQNDLLELQSDMLKPALDPVEFDMEKKVILEEIAQRYDDPHQFFIHNAYGDYFSEHPIGNNVLGSIESVSAISVEEMSDYYSRRYVPNNMVLSIAGNFDWEGFCEHAERYCSGWERTEATRQKPKFEFVNKENQFTKDNMNISHLMFILPGPSAQSEDRFASSVFNTIVADNTGSKLYWSLIEPGLAESVYCWTDDSDAFGRTTIYVSCNPENLDKVDESIKQVLADPMDFTEKDLDRAKVKIASRLALSSENTHGRMVSLATNWLQRQDLPSVKDTIRKVNEISKQNINNYLNQYGMDKYGFYKFLSA